MNAILICPVDRSNVPALQEYAPLSTITLCGKSLIAYWIELLVSKGATRISILAADRPSEVRNAVGDGRRWGIEVEVLPESGELSVQEARRKFVKSEGQWLPAPYDAVMVDRFPEAKDEAFSSYSAFMSQLGESCRFAASTVRVGLREIQPDVWIGLKAKVAPDVELRPPCWIGDHTVVRSGAIVGPGAVVENGCVIEPGAEVISSYIGEGTFVGGLTRVSDSIVFGNVLTNWKSGSTTQVPDGFLLSSLRQRKPAWKRSSLAGRLAAAVVLGVSLPVVALACGWSWFQGQRPLRRRTAVLPSGNGGSGGRVVYYELASTHVLWKRWPQVWNIVRGDFHWVGNRPLHPLEASRLSSDFERLWLAAPIGWVSQADAAGCCEHFSDEAKAHASFYAAQASFKLNAAILFHGVKALLSKRTPGAETVSRAPVFETKGMSFDIRLAGK